MPIGLDAAVRNFENVAGATGSTKQEMAAAAAEFQAADDAAGDPDKFSGVATAIKNAEISLGTGGGAAVQGFGGQAVSNEGDGSYDQGRTMQAVGSALSQAERPPSADPGLIGDLEKQLGVLQQELSALEH
ncbi:MAG: hypothetical protein INR65_19230, partial [Gluconacetobacter diazotrophicus]|nr:hypothetical protein [Gluconacetobacter diazotrophicus]